MVAVNELLWGKLKKFTTLDGMGGLDLSCNGKGPASLTLTDLILVADGADDTVFTPIDTVRIVRGQVRVFLVQALTFIWLSEA